MFFSNSKQKYLTEYCNEWLSGEWCGIFNGAADWLPTFLNIKCWEVYFSSLSQKIILGNVIYYIIQMLTVCVHSDPCMPISWEEFIEAE